jgi:hypothetical protein
VKIAPFSRPGRFFRGNLHTHSTLSDGALPPERAVEAYRNRGYDFVALTEHFSERYGWPLADTRLLRTGDFTTILGAELHAPATAVGELWHILALGLPDGFAPPARDETGPELAGRARRAGAFVAIAHPSWSQLTHEDGLSIDAAHAVEVYNHGCGVENDRGDGWYLLDRLSNAGRRLLAVAADDAHFRHGDRDAFGGWVNVKAEELDPEALLEALRAGAFYATQGPDIHELAIDGDELTLACSPVAAISIMGGTSRSLTRVGEAITGGSFDLSATDNPWLGAAETPWLRVVAIDVAGRRAWTNPIWRDA